MRKVTETTVEYEILFQMEFYMIFYTERIFLNNSSYLNSLLILPDWSLCSSILFLSLINYSKCRFAVSAPTVRGGVITAGTCCTTQRPFTSSVLAKAPWTESWPQRLRVPAGHIVCFKYRTEVRVSSDRV